MRAIIFPAGAPDGEDCAREDRMKAKTTTTNNSHDGRETGLQNFFMMVLPSCLE